MSQPASPMTVMIVVTHLLGSGHLSRALTLGRAFAQAGHRATVVSGGMPVPQLDHTGVDLVQLPAIRSDGVNFTAALTQDGSPAPQSLFEARKNVLSTTVQRLQPDTVITELFPFGRRSLRAEFIALLNEISVLEKRPLVLASVRDILAPPSKPSKITFAEDLIDHFYHGVLVHSDASAVPLDLSWPVSSALSQKLLYTGFVAPPAPAPHPARAGQGEVLVSAGGGNVGDTLFAAAKTAASQDPDRIWRLLVGGSDADKRITQLSEEKSQNTIIERARPDYRQMLNHAAASVSMCGYNTALDVLQTHVPAVFVPFDAGGEVEQTLRAKALAAHDGIAIVADAALSADSLCTAVQQVLSAPRRTTVLEFKGAAATVRDVEIRVRRHQA